MPRRKYRYHFEVQHWLQEDWSEFVCRALLPAMRWSTAILAQGYLLAREGLSQRFRELACVLVGHRWFYFDPTEKGPPTHKHCLRCYRLDLNL